MKIRILFVALFCCACLFVQAQRTESLLEKGWTFIKDDVPGAQDPNFNDSRWQQVTIPHDWAIYGPFSRNYDLQEVTITQNMEKKATIKTGRTGGLPYVGIGWYRQTFDVNGGITDKSVTLQFDGAMSEAQVYVNGKKACFWPYGYNSFFCDVTPLLNADGKKNILAVRLENKPQSSRWYSGAGLYRNVHLIVTNHTHIPVWGTYITTPHVGTDFSTVCLKTEVANMDEKKDVTIKTQIFNPKGKLVIEKTTTVWNNSSIQNFILKAPQLWSPETPCLYLAKTTLYQNNKQIDEYHTTFGIRSIEVVTEKGFFLNGRSYKIKGVCNHHDLGPLGAAVNSSAIRHRLMLLKNMGCNAIRTAHNMPSPELIQLCNKMGFLVMAESFDEWDVAKCKNGYHRYFKDWAEKDLVNLIHHYRNDPCIVMWSIGNEVPTQCSKQGYQVAGFLQNICHREDITRPVVCCMDQVDCVLKNGFAAQLDVPGFNYRVSRYKEAYSKLPQGFLLGSETSSTVSSRGVYHFPVVKKADVLNADHQCSSYDLNYCSWSNVPDEDLEMSEYFNWDMGQFVWSGFDYLGEPSPYDTDAWPNHSSMFGIIDLASLPKDRYYLYRSIWNKNVKTLHVLPHWTWPGREGKVTPVFVYTNYPIVELFVNGVSQGKLIKTYKNPQTHYRLMWKNVIYHPGTLKVVAYTDEGKVVKTKIVRTAGKPYRLLLSTDRTTLQANGKDLAFVTASIVDKEGNICPKAKNLVKFSVSGAGSYRASANGDPTCLYAFQNPEMPAFSGKLMVLVQSSKQTGSIQLKVTSKGLKGALMKFFSK